MPGMFVFKSRAPDDAHRLAVPSPLIRLIRRASNPTGGGPISTTYGHQSVGNRPSEWRDSKLFLAAAQRAFIPLPYAPGTHIRKRVAAPRRPGRPGTNAHIDPRSSWPWHGLVAVEPSRGATASRCRPPRLIGLSTPSTPTAMSGGMATASMQIAVRQRIANPATERAAEAN
jgi:hypothetical protein